MEEIERRAESVLADVPEWIWDGERLPVPVEDIADTCFGIYEPMSFGMDFAPQTTAHIALHVDDMQAARAELEAKGVEFVGETLDTGVCHMAFFHDPDGNALMLHHRYAPRDQEYAGT